ncbi:MAG: PepSY-associated TM helix domain-containing protein [Verrucomicrobiota bacterium]
MVKAFWKFHSWCGIYTGGFLALILITGAVAVFADHLYLWENRKVARIDSASLDPSRLNDWIEIARNEINVDSDTISLGGVFLPKDEQHALRVLAFNPAGARNPFALTNRPWLFTSVFIHPQTGEVLGKGNDDHSLSQYLRGIHVRLFAGTPGRNFVGLFGFTLLVNTVTGLIILSTFLGKKTVWVIRTKSLRLASADWHKLIGALLAVPALVFAITGLWLGLQSILMQSFSIENPARFKRDAIVEPVEDEKFKVDYSEAFARVYEAYPGFVIQQIIPSSKGEKTLTFKGKTKNMVYEELSQTVVLDKSDLSVLFVHNTHKSDWKQKLYFLQEGLHFGRFGGAWVQWLYLVVGILIGLLPITGYIIARLRKNQSLKPVFRWSIAGGIYSLVMLIVLKAFGLVTAMAYGTLLLAAFLLSLIIWTILRRWRSTRKPA